MDIISKLKDLVKIKEITSLLDLRCFLTEFFDSTKLDIEEIDQIFKYTKSGLNGMVLIDDEIDSIAPIINCFTNKNTECIFHNWSQNRIDSNLDNIQLQIDYSNFSILPFECGKYYIKYIIYSSHLEKYINDITYHSSLKNYIANNFNDLFSDEYKRNQPNLELDMGLVFFRIIGNGIHIPLSILDNYINSGLDNVLLRDFEYFLNPVVTYWNNKKLIKYRYSNTSYDAKLIRKYIKEMKKLKDGTKLLIELNC